MTAELPHPRRSRPGGAGLARETVWPQRHFSLIAGFGEAGESFESCAVREVAEEIGLDVRDVRSLGSQPWPFPRLQPQSDQGAELDALHPRHDGESPGCELAVRLMIELMSADSPSSAPVSARAAELRELLRRHVPAIDQILGRYGASNPRLFGSVARGDAVHDSDIDLYVDMAITGAEALWNLSGLSEDLRQLLGVRVDVVSGSVLRERVAASAELDLTPLT